jgi:hypothetical protein
MRRTMAKSDMDFFLRSAGWRKAGLQGKSGDARKQDEAVRAECGVLGVVMWKEGLGWAVQGMDCMRCRCTVEPVANYFLLLLLLRLLQPD